MSPLVSTVFSITSSFDACEKAAVIFYKETIHNFVICNNFITSSLFFSSSGNFHSILQDSLDNVKHHNGQQQNIHLVKRLRFNHKKNPFLFRLKWNVHIKFELSHPESPFQKNDV